MTDPAAFAQGAFWLVVGLAARAWLDDWLNNRHVRHTNRKRARGAG